jgi:hypothetical protein
MMNKLYTLIILLVLAFSSSYGQTGTPIEVKKVFGGYKYFQGDSRLNMNQLVVAMESNEIAFQQIKKAQSTNTLGMIIAGAGGFMIGWPLGTSIAGGDPNWVLAGIGAGLIVASIPISKKVISHTNMAVETYNNGLEKTSFWQRSELDLFMNGNQLGLALKF